MPESFRIILIYIVFFGLFVHQLLVVFDALKSGKVQHKWYILESNKLREFDDRKNNPIHYWITVLVNFIFLVLPAWAVVAIKF